MRVSYFDTFDPVPRERLNTNTVARLDGVVSFSELLPVLEELRARYAPARLVCTLDDVNQCAYTSMHASFDDRLDYRDDGYDEKDSAAVHHADNSGAVRIAAALEDPGLRVEWAALDGTRAGTEATIAALIEANRHPERVLDDVVLIQRVPVPRDDLAIAGIPNGYFESDWDIFRNHAVVRRLAVHGYRHIGIGAAFLGFDRPTAPTMDEAHAVAADLAHLYGAAAAPEWPELAAVLATQRLLILGYAEDFTDTLDR
ncbi:hypothetical protein GFY24_33230 [Nocardia sp. SYP-A9097]|uniref:hypothetical protein n=1 Tax=Nocardia sp. SYP-A9097 TaxID=2663237 RepID=UPI00129BCC7A|nr:hypothetical protein [Nocardia sp. SYP-A9097]MRH92243.1 hypothetical protein [Nocardia sp. SYP-A9097]